MTDEAIDFMGFRFARGTREALEESVLALVDRPYGYVVTPNVDFVTRAATIPECHELYGRASLQLCDSRILALLARTKGLELSCYPGADLVADLMRADGYGYTVAVVGPTADDIAELRKSYPDTDLTLIEAPRRMEPGSAAWTDCVAAVAQAEWDIVLICLGSPKQERFAADVGEIVRATDRTGVALCVGASIDYLTGRQKRAPRAMQVLHLEWAFRLLSEPGRLWRRYLVDGPKVLRLYLRDSRSPGVRTEPQGVPAEPLVDPL